MTSSTLFSQSYSGTFGIAYHIILNDPALVPVGCYHPDLFGCRSCPLCSSLTYMKSADCNKIDTRLIGINASSSASNFYQFFIRIEFLKVCPDYCGVCITFAVPCIC